MDNLRLSLEDWLAVNIKSGGDNDSITVPDLFAEFVKDNKNIHVTYPMFAMVSGRLMMSLFTNVTKGKKDGLRSYKQLKWINEKVFNQSEVPCEGVSVIKFCKTEAVPMSVISKTSRDMGILEDNNPCDSVDSLIIDKEAASSENENVPMSIISKTSRDMDILEDNCNDRIDSYIIEDEVASSENENVPMSVISKTSRDMGILEDNCNDSIDSYIIDDEVASSENENDMIYSDITSEDNIDMSTESCYVINSTDSVNIDDEASSSEKETDNVISVIPAGLCRLDKNLGIKKYFTVQPKDERFVSLNDEEEDTFEEKQVKYRKEIKENQNLFNFLVYSRHCNSQEVRFLTPNNMPSDFSSLEMAISVSLPKPLVMNDVRKVVYDRSAVFKTDFEKKVMAFLCCSFLPIKSGTMVSKAYPSTAFGDKFPQFSMEHGSKLVFRCEICQPFVIWNLNKDKRAKGNLSIFEGFRQVYSHFVSKNHSDALNWWTSSSASLNVFRDNSNKNRLYNRKIVEFLDSESPSVSKQVPCMYLWGKEFVEQFKDDTSIRRKQPKTLFREKKLWLLCKFKKDHENCNMYKNWKELHKIEYKDISNESNSSSSSVYVPGSHNILISGKSITLNGGIKNLDPLCTGIASSTGKHPHTCENCHKQISDLGNLIKKRKAASLNRSEERIGKPGFRRTYAGKTESKEKLKILTEENRVLTNVVTSFHKFSLSARTWQEMLMNSCQTDDQEKLIIDLLSLFSQPITKGTSLQFEVIKNITGKLKSGVNHKFSLLIKDISIIHKNRLGAANYSLMQNIFGLPGKTTAITYAKKEKLTLGLNMHVFDKACELYGKGPVIDCTDEARILRYIHPDLCDDHMELIGQCFSPNIDEWGENKVMLPKAGKDFVDDFSALKDYIDNIVQKKLLAKSCGIHNFAALSGTTNNPMIYLIWPTPNRGYNAESMLKIWDKVRYHCFIDENKKFRENPILLMGHSSDSAGFQLSAASCLMTPCKKLMDLGVKYLTLGIGETVYAAPYLSDLPSIAYLDYDHEIRLLFKCLKYETLDLTMWDGVIVSIDHLKELKKVLSNIGTHCPFADGDLLFARYLDQNCDAALKVFTNNVADLLEKHIPGSEGTVLYIRAVVQLLSPFISPSDNPNQMQQSLSTGITVLRLWKKTVQHKKWKLRSVKDAKFDPSKRGKFLTYGCSKTAEILFAAGSSHMLAIYAHFKHLSPESVSPYKCGTRTTERIVSELQGKTNQIQCLDSQPTLGDVLQRISNVQVNQLSEESLIAAGAIKSATSNRKRISMDLNRAIVGDRTYNFPLFYQDFIEQQRKFHREGVQQGKKLFEKYCEQAATYLKKKKMWDFLEKKKSDIPVENQYDGYLPPEYGKEMLLNIESSQYLVPNIVEEEIESEENENDMLIDNVIDDPQFDNEIEDGNDYKSDGKNIWFLTRLVNNIMLAIHILRAIKVLLPREYVSRERSRRHIAANFLPGMVPIDTNHDVVKYRFVLFDSNMALAIGKVICLEKEGKSVVSALSTLKEARMRVLLFTSCDDEFLFIVTSPAMISKWLSVSHVYGEVQLKYVSETGAYQLCDKSILNYKRISQSLQSRKDFKLAKQISATTLGSEYQIVEDIKGKRIDPKTHSLLYLVKFQNADVNDKDLWLPMSSFSESFKFNARGKKKFACLSGGTTLFALKDTIIPVLAETKTEQNLTDIKPVLAETKTEQNLTDIKLVLDETKTEQNLTFNITKTSLEKLSLFKCRTRDEKEKERLKPITVQSINIKKENICALSPKRNITITKTNKEKSKRKIDVINIEKIDTYAPSNKKFKKCNKRVEKKENFKKLLAKNREIKTQQHTTILEEKDILDIKLGECLNDRIIFAALQILKNQFPKLNGFQDTVLSEKMKLSSVAKPAIQIHFVESEHWVTSYYTGDIIEVYDSRFIPPTKLLQCQFSQCYATAISETGSLSLCYPSVQQQENNTSCGLFAIAFAVDKAFGISEEDVDYDHEQMANHLKTCLHKKIMCPFPRLSLLESKIRENNKKKIEIIIICQCGLPAFGETIFCCRCCEEFHVNCVINSDNIWEKPKWKCEKCVKEILKR